MDYFASARSIASNNKIDPTRIEIIQQWRIGLTSKCKIKDIGGSFSIQICENETLEFYQTVGGRLDFVPIHCIPL
jgi:hypothetical protein